MKFAIHHLISGGNARNKILNDQGEKAQRDIDIHTAWRNPGYTLKEIADYSGIHYTGGNKVITKIVLSKKLIFQGLTFGPLWGNSLKEALKWKKGKKVKKQIIFLKDSISAGEHF